MKHLKNNTKPKISKITCIVALFVCGLLASNITFAQGNNNGFGTTYFGPLSGVYGHNNTYIGNYAGNASNTNSVDNSFLGSGAGRYNPNSYGTFIGAYAGHLNNGTRNTFIGKSAGHSNNSGNRNVFLGFEAGYNEQGSDKLYISNSNTATPLLYGEFNHEKLRVGGDLYLTNGSGTGRKIILAGNISSDGAIHSIGIENYWTEFRSHASEGWKFITGNDNQVKMQINGVNGRVGIGTTSPENRLHVVGNMKVEGNNPSLLIKDTGNNPSTFKIFNDEGMGIHQMSGASGSGTRFFIDQATGFVGIGKTDPKETLDVSGSIKAKRVVLDIGTFPDYVFADDYSLMPLADVEAYIKANKHLPKMPTEATVVENGADLGKINILLVEKVEELTLYTIAQEKELQAQKATSKQLLEQLTALQKQINELAKK